MSGNIYTRIAANFPPPSKNFIRTHDGRSISYGDLESLSARMANALASAGVAPGDRVAVQVEKSPEGVILFLACARIGAIYLPLNTAYTLNELEYFISDAEPKLVVCAPEKKEGPIAALAAKFGAKTLTLGTDGLSGSFLSTVFDAADGFQDVIRAPTDLAAILYTSGTTGRSKGAMLSHDNLLSNALTMKKVWRYTGEDVLLHALPVYHTHGLFVATNTLLVAGGSMIFLPRLDANEIMKHLPDATSMMGVPTFYTRLLDDARLNKATTKHIRLFVSGSAPLLAETHRLWEERTGHRILERYGMTETNMNTSNPYEGERVPGSVGFPLPDVSLRIVDPETGAPVKDGDIGMIEVKGPNVFQGYWRMPEKTKAEFRADGFFITGDLGRKDEKGYVYIVGRGKDLVISGGFNVYPKEVESEIDALPGVNESAVFGVAHKDFGEGVTAVVVMNKGASLDEKTVQTALKERLAAFKLPKRVIFLDDLPRNAMGKVQKNILRETYKDLYSR